MKRLALALAWLLAFLLPVHSFAQSWTEGTPIASVVTDYDQTFTWSYSAAGESNNLDVSACNKPVVTINGANAVTGYSCQSAGAAKTACTPVVSVLGGSFGPEPVAFPGGFAKFAVSAFSGASSVEVECTSVRNQISNSGAWEASSTDDDQPDDDSEVPDSITIDDQGSVDDAAIPAGITRDSELAALTIDTVDPVDNTNACSPGDLWLNNGSGTEGFFLCVTGDGSTTGDWWTIANPPTDAP